MEFRTNNLSSTENKNMQLSVKGGMESICCVNIEYGIKMN